MGRGNGVAIVDRPWGPCSPRDNAIAVAPWWRWDRRGSDDMSPQASHRYCHCCRHGDPLHQRYLQDEHPCPYSRTGLRSAPFVRRIRPGKRHALWAWRPWDLPISGRNGCSDRCLHSTRGTCTTTEQHVCVCVCVCVQTGWWAIGLYYRNQCVCTYIIFALLGLLHEHHAVCLLICNDGHQPFFEGKKYFWFDVFVRCRMNLTSECVRVRWNAPNTSWTPYSLSSVRRVLVRRVKAHLRRMMLLFIRTELFWIVEDIIGRWGAFVALCA